MERRAALFRVTKEERKNEREKGHEDEVNYSQTHLVSCDHILEWAAAILNEVKASKIDGQDALGNVCECGHIHTHSFPFPRKFFSSSLSFLLAKSNDRLFKS